MLVVDATAAMDVVVPVRPAAVHGLARVVVHDRALGRDRAVHLAVAPSHAAAPNQRMDQNRRWSSPALVRSNVTLSQNLVPVHRSGTSPAPARVPSLSVVRAVVPSPRITNPVLVLPGIRTHVRAPDHEIVPTRKTSETNLVLLHPKIMTIRLIGTTKVTRIKFSVVFVIGKVSYVYINTQTYIFTTLTS